MPGSFPDARPKMVSKTERSMGSQQIHTPMNERTEKKYSRSSPFTDSVDVNSPAH